MRILRNNFFETGNSNMNRGSLVIDHLLFYEKRLFYCTSVFWLVKVNPVHRSWSYLNCTSYCKADSILNFFFENFHCLVYHIKYHHKAFRGILIKSLLIRPIILLYFLIFWSTWALKLSFEFKTIPKSFWCGYCC